MEYSLGLRIREMREKRGLTQDQLAEKLEMKPANVSSYERNKSVPPISKLNSLASILNTTTEYLLGKTDNPNPIDEDLMRVANYLFHQLDNSIEYFVLLFDGEYPFAKKMITEFFDAISEASTSTGTKVYLNIKHNGPIDFKQISDSLITGTSTEFKIAVVDKLKYIAKKYHLWEDPRDFYIGVNPSSHVVEKEFVESLELSNEELIEIFNPKLDGQELDEEEYRDMLAYVRVKRRMKNSSSFDGSK